MSALSFKDLPISTELISKLDSLGYKVPTDVQAQTIAPILQGSDILACAPTGTGKTAAFCLPLLDILSHTPSKARMPRALILEPTRELAFQVLESFQKYSPFPSLSFALITGGESSAEQKKILNKSVDVLIVTPGRFLDLYEAGHIILTQVKFFVIDEADRMMDMGFIPDVRKIKKLLPPIKQTLLFSATFGNQKEIDKLSKEFLVHPKTVNVAPPSSTARTVEQHFIKVKKTKTLRDKEKRATLRRMIESYHIQSAIIFCNRKSDITILKKSLDKHGYSSDVLHGDLTQEDRKKALEAFKNQQSPFLIASDVAARGIHINDLPVVINFDVPMQAEDYVHRIGRTGRAGQTGRAFTLVEERDDDQIKKLSQLIKEKITVSELSKEKEEPAAKKTAAKTPPSKKEKKSFQRSAPLPEGPDEDRFGSNIPAFLKR